MFYAFPRRRFTTCAGSNPLKQMPVGRAITFARGISTRTTFFNDGVRFSIPRRFIAPVYLFSPSGFCSRSRDGETRKREHRQTNCRRVVPKSRYITAGYTKNTPFDSSRLFFSPGVAVAQLDVRNSRPIKNDVKKLADDNRKVAR